MAVLRVEPLPDGALDAAAAFHAKMLPDAVRLSRDEDLVLIFGPAPHDHRGWRLAAVRDLARRAAPMRVNAVAGSDEAAIAETLRYLDSAPGVTGQLFAVDGKFTETR